MIEMPMERAQYLRDRVAALETAARDVIIELREERICCDDCDTLGKEPWWSPAEQRLLRLLGQDDCQHRTQGLRGTCELCGAEIVANGCGPGYITADKLTDGSGWAVCSDRLARWFGTPAR